jgi:transposase
MSASAATVLRLVRQQVITASATPQVLGVDDFAFRKGRTYGTVLVDLELHKVVDVLAERTSKSLAEWLKEHPGVEVVARDRSTEYARGVREGAPGAVQVADRWHLLLNLKQVLERWLGRVHARLRRLPAIGEGYTLPSREHSFYRSRAAEAASLDSRARRLARYEEVKRLYESGKGLLTIARETGLDRKTVRKYAYADSFPERSRKPWFSAIDPYLGYLEARHAEGCEDATQRDCKGVLGYSEP